AGDVDADHDVLIVPVAGGVRQVLEADLQFLPARLDAGQDLVGAVRIERGGGWKTVAPVSAPRLALFRIASPLSTVAARSAPPGATKERLPARWPEGCKPFWSGR